MGGQNVSWEFVGHLTAFDRIEARRLFKKTVQEWKILVVFFPTSLLHAYDLMAQLLEVFWVSTQALNCICECLDLVSTSHTMFPS